MSDTLYLVWRYAWYHRWKTLILVTSVTLIVYLPIGLNVLIEQSGAQLTARAQATPLLIGARGSALELTLNSLYFSSATPAATSVAQAERIAATGLATPVPLYARFVARGYPIVGTGLGYFEFRDLRPARGRPFAMLGEAVLGANVARKLSLGPGDTLVSSPENVFDLAGVYPLRMRIVGVLEPSYTADDTAIFVDVKTAWVMEGLGHGHQDLDRADAEAAVLRRDRERIVANASVVQYNEITADNVDSFHFHGPPETFPLSAVIALPADEKSGVILQGRYQGQDEASQIVRPVEVVAELLGTVLTIQRFVLTAVVIVGAATAATAVLVFLLSLRLRRRERLTLFKIGGARGTIAALLLAEVAGVLVISAALAVLLTALTGWFGADAVRALLLS